ncbi:hypothetical protein QUQ16_004464 [Escherichia coli]|nr:hypothetical protein [Escherichia coli]
MEQWFTDRPTASQRKPYSVWLPVVLRYPTAHRLTADRGPTIAAVAPTG